MKTVRFSGKGLKILLHITVWIIVFLIPAFILTIDSKGDDHFYFVVIAQTLSNFILFYVNYFWLVPKLFLGGKKVIYFVVIVIVVVGYSFAIEQSEKYFRHGPPQGGFPDDKMLIVEFTDQGDTLVYEDPNPHHEFKGGKPPTKKWPVYNSILISFLICGFSIGLRLSDQHITQEKRRKEALISGLSVNLRFAEQLFQQEKLRKEAEKEKLNSELMLLKNQISPHLFFNTLNNIYALTESNTEEAQKAILQLSKLMRYMLYDSENGNTKISKEIEFIKNYIELMKLRLSPKVELKISFPEEYTDIALPPLLFIPFIENAFKHGVSYSDPSFIRINMQIDTKEILFSCSNSVCTTSNNSDNLASGIGLENVKKRLSLLFPEKHTLTIDQSDSLYVVILQINLA